MGHVAATLLLVAAAGAVLAAAALAVTGRLRLPLQVVRGGSGLGVDDVAALAAAVGLAVLGAVVVAVVSAPAGSGRGNAVALTCAFAALVALGAAAAVRGGERRRP